MQRWRRAWREGGTEALRSTSPATVHALVVAARFNDPAALRESTVDQYILRICLHLAPDAHQAR
ncbi:hypothetical protein ABT272_44400 [Streptomyces sp900105245]|uniref:Uncharacterized protein n=1 Tax=Streptomyces sp. 900105245 TaxID=3154379 RepID=A0ABV1ULF5_9ACTN